MAEAPTPAPTQSNEIRWELSSQPGGVLQVDPDVMNDAATEYDGMADRLQAALDKHQQAAKFGAAGRDEVSTSVEAAFHKTSDNFDKVAKDGIEQFRRIAEAFRRNARGFVDTEESNVTALRNAGM